MMISIILSILKIIGIILLCILGLILTAIIVVLFVPVRYKIIADSDINEVNKDYHVTAKFSWLLCLVRGRYNYPSEDGLTIKVGPFTVYGAEKKEKPPKKKKKKDKETEMSVKEDASTSDSSKEEIIEKEIEDNSTEKEDIYIGSVKRKTLKETFSRSFAIVNTICCVFVDIVRSFVYNSFCKHLFVKYSRSDGKKLYKRVIITVRRKSESCLA